MQNELTQPGQLLSPHGNLNQVGWARQPLLDCNLENVAFYPPVFRFWQFARLKRWDYYAIFTPQRFFSATIAHLGYAGNIFVYTLDWESGDLHEEGLVIPLGGGVSLERNPLEGEAHFRGQGVEMRFQITSTERVLAVDWPAFHQGRGIAAEIRLAYPPSHQSMNIVIPFPGKRFYYNHKVNCLPASGWLRYGEAEEELRPEAALGQLDWGRGVWPYSSFWQWASASGFLPDGRRVGLNLGSGFGDTSQATENAVIVDGVIHKLDSVTFDYNPADFMQPWQFRDNQQRLQLTFTPFKERVAATHLGIIDSEVHQMFGFYQGTVVTDQGEELPIEKLIGFAEEHHARW